jgi:hypothetical protein
MPTTAKQDLEFVQVVIPDRLLEMAIDWIRSNLDPDDVFGANDLDAWAESHGYAEVEEE